MTTDDGSQLSFLADTRTQAITRRANVISKRASKTRRVDRSQQLKLFAANEVAARIDLKHSHRYSREVVRDAMWRVELEQEGPEHERHVRERAALVLRGTFEPLPGLPGPTRAQCPSNRATEGCAFVNCRHHLWRLDGGPDGNRAGRPGLALVPRNARGLTERVLGDMVGDYSPTTLEPRWLEPGRIKDSCALDVAGRGKASNEEVGRALGRHRTLIGKEGKEALQEAKGVAAEMEMTEGDLLKGLRELGAGQ